ncbi:MAG TPA: DUF1641 domain-containing protein [Flavilitoribacter sp.]|nr:DUF1641 domain-containing protein [Flavilitoribacter sp.]
MTNSTAFSAWQETDAGRQMLDRFSEERTLTAIEHLLSRLDTLEKAVDNLTVLMQQGPGLVAMATDSIDEIYSKADEHGNSMETHVKNGLEMAGKLTAPGMPERLDQVLTMTNQLPGIIAMMADTADEMMQKAVAGGFDPQALVSVAGAANRALTAAGNGPPAKASGIFGLLRALKDPDRQKGLGFLLNFLKHFGKHL